MNPGAQASELVRLIDLAALRLQGQQSLEIEASAAERGAIARRLGVPRMDSLSASLVAEPWKGEGVRIHGEYRAALEQTCVVTLEPIAVTLTEPLEVCFGTEAAGISEALDEALDPEAPDPPEPLPEGNFLNAGELIVQLLAVALDPYPRSPGAVFAEAKGTAADPGTAENRPFSKLAALKQPEKG
jgi:hypothetical protein